HVTARLLAPATALSMERLDSLWPTQEIWVFEARRDIRVVEPAGAPLVDPSQTGLPEDWKGLPAYRLGHGDTLRLVEKQRGNPSPQAGALNLSRQIWLDFSGKGYTQKDAVTGRLFRRTRLEMRPGAELGRAEISGRPVSITSHIGRAGVEVPAGDLHLVALSRHERGYGGTREVTGWNQGFQSLQVGLHLPPGWRLVHADGPDGVANSWVSDWSLWDVFLLCILTLGVLRLTGRLGALLAFATFVLLSQEPGLDGLLWLNLLAAVGLVRVLSVGRLRAWAHRYALAGLALLVALWIPFAIVHVREALYPQLDGPGGSAYGYANLNMLDLSRSGSYGSGRGMDNAAPPESDEMEKAAEAPRPLARLGTVPGSGGRPMTAAEDARASAGTADEDEGVTYAKVQTGPGEPAWGWESARLSWSGPVQEGETMRLYLMPPWLTRLARIFQALLPGVLLVLLGLSAGVNRPGADGSGFGARWRFRLRWRGVAGAALLILSAAPGIQAQFPPDTLLRELEQRLLAPPACSPTCVTLASGAVAIEANRLRVALVFDAVDTAVTALPQGGRGQWALESLRLDERPAATAAGLPGGGLTMVVPPGRHRVLVEGRILGTRLELAFGDDARNLTVEARGYTVQGLKDGRAEGGTLVFLRSEAPAGRGDARRALAPDAVPPFVEVHRTLDFGQEWTLETRVLRVVPASGAFSVEIPLLPFEHPLSPGMASDKGSTLVSFQEGQADAGWRSTVDRRDTLAFSAGDLARFAETWKARAASRWHLEMSGPAPVETARDPGLTVWRPIPGDILVLSVSEPKPVGGPVKTVESASLSHRPGRREASTSLTLAYRAGQGDVARITLPAGARLDNLTVDGMSQPLTQREGTL
ncbi:MAG TPA: hypothetical protein VK465_04005, partial [Fibrobacteria bacterium]|nr:hypothetical protein [Fibrobacteria bacterium]